MDTSSLGNEVNAYGFIHGIILSIAASIIGGVSKLCLRKSYILEKDRIPTLISYDESGEFISILIMIMEQRSVYI